MNLNEVRCQRLVRTQGSRIFLQIQKTFYEIKVGFGNFSVFSQVTFPLFRFLCQDVTLERLLVSDLAGAGYFETLLGTRVCFYFRHFNTFNCYTLLAPPIHRGTFWALWAIGSLPTVVDKNRKWSAKVGKNWSNKKHFAKKITSIHRGSRHSPQLPASPSQRCIN